MNTPAPATWHDHGEAVKWVSHETAQHLAASPVVPPVVAELPPAWLAPPPRRTWMQRHPRTRAALRQAGRFLRWISRGMPL